MNLIEADEQSLREWGKCLDEIKTFISAHIDTKENGAKLLKLIFDFEDMGRARSRINAALNILEERK